MVWMLALAAALLGTWLCPPTREVWDALDLATFQLLNGNLEGSRPLQVFWAIANHRAFDLLPFVITLWLAKRFVFDDGGRHAASRAALTLAAALTMLVGRKVGTADMFEFDRDSPSLAVEGALRLSQAVPWIDAKDSSRWSYPGDHCMFLVMLTIFFWVVVGRRSGLIFLAITVACSLPRLVSGGHWLTDDLVGSTVIALPTMGIFFGTSLHTGFARALLPLTSRVLARRERRPRATA